MGGQVLDRETFVFVVCVSGLMFPLYLLLLNYERKGVLGGVLISSVGGKRVVHNQVAVSGGVVCCRG